MTEQPVGPLDAGAARRSLRPPDPLDDPFLADLCAEASECDEPEDEEIARIADLVANEEFYERMGMETWEPYEDPPPPRRKKRRGKKAL